MLAAGVTPDLIEEYLDKVNRLPNLQLLSGLQNIEKQAKVPAEWLEGANFASPESRRQYELVNDVDLVGDLSNLLNFYADRRKRMAQRLRTILVLSTGIE